MTHAILTSYYPLHNEGALATLLTTNWASSFFCQTPFEELRSYFGEAIALYFIFTGYYTFYLCYPAGLALLLALLTWVGLLPVKLEIFIVSISNLLFITYLFKNWRRECSQVAHAWGTFKLNVWEEVR